MDTNNIRSKISYSEKSGPFGTDFLGVYGDKAWIEDPVNQAAAHQFRTELISRIATIRLVYGSGVERTALESVVDLFRRAREITASNVGCGTFEILVWYVLNSSVRPFTAKWHPLSKSGVLDALDASDDFRAELYGVQNDLRDLERVLALLEGDSASFNSTAPIQQVKKERKYPEADWRPAGGYEGFAASERKAVEQRRANYEVERGDWAAGLALSGGGIRSATFSFGVLAALARRNLLPEFDYLSTVSGGGYTGSFLTSLIGREDAPENVGLREKEEPFRRTEQESELLMGVRQRASFLSGGPVERVLLVMRSSYGVFVNALVLVTAIAFVALIEVLIRAFVGYSGAPSWLGWLCPLIAMLGLKFVARKEQLELSKLNWWHLVLGAIFGFPLAWKAMQGFHELTNYAAHAFGSFLRIGDPAGILLVGTIAFAIFGAVSAVYASARSTMATVVTVLLLLFVEHTFVEYLGTWSFGGLVMVLSLTVGLGLVWLSTDVNETSLYRYYRSKLATAFIYRKDGEASPRISDFAAKRSFFPILNCAINAPGSKNPKMRGRLSDVFSFTPVMTGSNLTGYQETTDWETANPKLDLAAMMALSGAAVSPQMGLRTTRRQSFWLTLFNARLHAWLKKPNGTNAGEGSNSKTKKNFFQTLSNRLGFSNFRPGLGYLVKEFRANADETLPHVNISDGGHIENLGIYELLRRRCRYIVAIDGEADPSMTFHGLTNLQRLAYIDMGVLIDAELDELRLMDSGFSRSHFRFCRIRYPLGSGGDDWEVGYMLYVKLSLTGNEGEFLRRYRLDEPSFPHHSTADQFFTETQFEAYRSLGEHIGDKLFMNAIIEDLADKSELKIEEWMGQYAKNFLGLIPSEGKST